MRETGLVGALLVAALLCLAGGHGPKQDSHDKELARLEGDWKMVSFEFNGKQEPADAFRENRPMLQIRRTKMTFRLQDKTLWEGDFTIDPRKHPKTLDVTIKDGEGKGEQMLTIYELDGDSLKIASGWRGATEPKRPSEFRSKDGDAVVAGYSRRQK